MDTTKGKAPERRGATVVIHRADTLTEAVVIRGLLESAGIDSPSLTRTDPYPFSNPPAEFPGAEILVREADVEEARRIIGEYLSAGESDAAEPTDESDEPSED